MQSTMIIWLKLPTKVAAAAFQLFSGFTNNILPPYSPTLAGVNKEKTNPPKMVLIDCPKDCGSKFLERSCHFLASKNQFSGIKTKHSKSHKGFDLLKDALKVVTSSEMFSLTSICS